GGSNVDGYNDYRGVPVVGAWTWLPDYGFGVTTELDVAEAYQTLYAVRTTFWVLITLLTAGALGGLVASRVIYRLHRTVSEVQQLGQYRVGDKIGEGGMGAVYHASHAMLRRDAAIKILKAGDASGERVARFEREVQLTSALRHPNTIEIYDYGRSPDGTFYYVMEYLKGLSLRDIVQESGPLPPERVIHILKQTCGSLAEAHEAGLIHRDVTPGNIVLCELGGLYDVVKVLDFGLVKDVGSNKGPQLTQVGQIAGTPHYMAPETLIDPDKVDARLDLYALGGVGYYMATGNTVFSGETTGEVLSKQLNEAPVPLSKHLHGAFPKDLERVLMQCLAKAPADRPESAAVLLEMLGGLEDAQGWDFREAKEWWTRRSADSLGAG
ncbi:MAG: serine/threonine-protein kinase, partial [Planctomycetota bacterium]|nr:serine/threonine-protein kinase [Planctomycetota bacterium]